jgi:hypothetical protein
MASLYLSFDCATKTFAFSLSKIDLDSYYNNIDRLSARVKNATRLIQAIAKGAAVVTDQIMAEISESVRKLDVETDFIEIIDGEMIDLFPGVLDSKINSVDRIKSVSKYIKNRIIPSVEAAKLQYPDAPIHIMVEYQMGPNFKAREVASAIIAIFAEYSVVVVNPSLKNKISTSAEGEYKNFTSKYTTTYGANKAHTKYNFEIIEKVFKSRITKSSNAEKGHIADSFMQVLGYLIWG